MEPLKCTATVTVAIGKKSWHEICGQPASECEFTGDLTTAKAILCARHKHVAEEQIKREREGKKAKRPDPRQILIPGLAILNQGKG